MEEKRDDLAIIENVKLDMWSALDKPVDYNGEGDFRFKAKFLIPKSDVKQLDMLKNIIKTKAHEEFGANIGNKIEAFFSSGDPQKCCFLDGDLLKQDYYSDHIVISAANKNPPTVVDLSAKEIPKHLIYNTLYPGCLVEARVSFYFKLKYGNLPRCTVEGVQFMGEGDRLDYVRKSDPSEFRDLSDQGGGTQDLSTKTNENQDFMK